MKKKHKKKKEKKMDELELGRAFLHSRAIARLIFPPKNPQKSKLMLGLSWKGKRRNLKQNKTK
jgi:hypothetical protein